MRSIGFMSIYPIYYEILAYSLDNDEGWLLRQGILARSTYHEAGNNCKKHHDLPISVAFFHKAKTIIIKEEYK